MHNQKKLKHFEYIIENCDTHEMIIANKMDLDIFIEHFINYSIQQRRRGYRRGYSAGHDRVRYVKSHH